jgi:hypothetical protein
MHLHDGSDCDTTSETKRIRRKVMQLRQWKPVVGTLALTGLMNLGLLSPGTVLAGQEKIDVCHSEGNGTYHLITIAEPAYETHVAHGDAEIDESVPGNPGYIFAEDCTLMLACPCNNAEVSVLWTLIDQGDIPIGICYTGTGFEGLVDDVIVFTEVNEVQEVIAISGFAEETFGVCAALDAFLYLTVEQTASCKQELENAATDSNVPCEPFPEIIGEWQSTVYEDRILTVYLNGTGTHTEGELTVDFVWDQNWAITEGHVSLCDASLGPAQYGIWTRATIAPCVHSQICDINQDIELECVEDLVPGVPDTDLSHFHPYSPIE